MLLILTFGLVVQSLAYGGRRAFLDVNLQFMTATRAPQNLSLYQQVVVTTTGMPMTTTNAAQLAMAGAVAAQQAQAAAAQQAQAVAASQAVAQQTAIQQAVVAAEAAMATTTPPPTTAAAMVVPGAPGAAPGAAPAGATVAPGVPGADVPDAGISMPDVAAADLVPMTAEADPEAAERLMRAAKANAQPTGPEVKVIADWAERFGKYSVDATVKAMRNVVSQIAREKAEEVIANVFNAKYPNLHVHGVLPPAPAAAMAGPAPAPAAALAPGEKIVG